MGKLQHLCTRGQNRQEYLQIGMSTAEGNNSRWDVLYKYIGSLQMVSEVVAFLVQLGVVVAAIPAVLDIKENKDVSILIILPLSLLLISFVWSGWIQKRAYSKTQEGSTRLKAGKSNLVDSVITCIVCQIRYSQKSMCS